MSYNHSPITVEKPAARFSAAEIMTVIANIRVDETRVSPKILEILRQAASDAMLYDAIVRTTDPADREQER